MALVELAYRGANFLNPVGVLRCARLSADKRAGARGDCEMSRRKKDEFTNHANDTMKGNPIRVIRVIRGHFLNSF